MGVTSIFGLEAAVLKNQKLGLEIIPKSCQIASFEYCRHHVFFMARGLERLAGSSGMASQELQDLSPSWEYPELAGRTKSSTRAEHGRLLSSITPVIPPFQMKPCTWLEGLYG